MMQAAVELVLLGAVLAGSLCIVLATAYDLKNIRRAAKYRQIIRGLVARHQPQVSIIITGGDDARQLLGFLQEIKKIRYTRYDTVAVTHGLGTRARRELTARARMNALRLYAPRRQREVSGILAEAYRRSQRGELVVVLSAHDRIEPMAIKSAVAALQNDSSLDGVQLIGAIDAPATMAQIVGAFFELSNRLVTKATAMMRGSRRRVNGTPGVYWSRYLKKQMKHSDFGARVVYRHGLKTSTVRSPARPTRWYGWVWRFGLIAIVTYSSVVAAGLQSTWPLTMMWTVSCLWLLAVVWFDETTGLRQKAVMSLAVPIGVFVTTAFYMVQAAVGAVRLKTF